MSTLFFFFWRSLNVVNNFSCCDLFKASQVLIAPTRVFIQLSACVCVCVEGRAAAKCLLHNCTWNDVGFYCCCCFIFGVFPILLFLLFFYSFGFVCAQSLWTKFSPCVSLTICVWVCLCCMQFAVVFVFIVFAVVAVFTAAAAGFALPSSRRSATLTWI